MTNRIRDLSYVQLHIACALPLLGMTIATAAVYGQLESSDSCCKITTSCTDGVLVTDSGGTWDDGCEVDAHGNCISHDAEEPDDLVCFRCTGSGNGDLCFASDPGDFCKSTRNTWDFLSCGTRKQYQCGDAATGTSGGPSGCCRPDAFMKNTTDSCSVPKCDSGTSIICS